MSDDREKAATPLVKPRDGERRDGAPAPVDTDAPTSTDEAGEAVDLPDKGGAID